MIGTQVDLHILQVFVLIVLAVALLWFLVGALYLLDGLRQRVKARREQEIETKLVVALAYEINNNLWRFSSNPAVLSILRIMAIEMRRTGCCRFEGDLAHAEWSKYMDRLKADEDDRALRAEVISCFAGVGALSPEIYEHFLNIISLKTGRKFDDKLRSDVANIVKEIPCPLD